LCLLFCVLFSFLLLLFLLRILELKDIIALNPGTAAAVDAQAELDTLTKNDKALDEIKKKAEEE
jgi:predicted transcriptional regulator